MVDITLRSSRSAPLTNDMVDANFSNLNTAIEAIQGGGSSPFTDLSDTPANYTGHGNKLVTVKAAEDGLEFTTAGSPTDHGGLTGLGDDDHTQYHTDARGDARYEKRAWVVIEMTGPFVYSTAVNVNLRCDTTTYSWDVLLPASPSDGDIVRVADAYGTWATNNLTISPGGATDLLGLSETLTCDINYASFGLIYDSSDTSWWII